MQQSNLLSTRRGRFVSFALLYVSEGLPFGFSGVAIVNYLRTQNASLEEIGLLAGALFLPWSFKWAWAPLVDMFRFNAYGGRKAWILACLVMMITLLLGVLALDVSQDFTLLVTLMVIMNVFSATQDVAIDSLAVSTLQPDERARGNGYMFAGQYAGIGIGGAGAIAMFGWIGFDATLLLVATLLTCNTLFVVYFVRDPDAAQGLTTTQGQNPFIIFAVELRNGFFRSGRGPLLALLFSVIPGAAIALAYATLATIQVDYGLESSRIALLTAVNTVFAALGCVFGGMLGDRYNSRVVLFVSCLATTIPTVALATVISNVGLTNVSIYLFSACIIAHGFCFGSVFGVRAAVFMSVANPVVGATMFTAFMALSNLATSYTNFWQGQVAGSYGYDTVLFIDAALIVFGLAIIPWLKEREVAAATQPSR